MSKLALKSEGAAVKRLSICLAFVISIMGLTPVHAVEKGLALSGLPVAAADGFTGRGVEFALVSNGLLMKNAGVRSAVISEACFMPDWFFLDCSNGKKTQVGKGAATKTDEEYAQADTIVYSLAGGRNSIAPAAKFHAIRVGDLAEDFSAAVAHALTKNVDAILVTDIGTAAPRGGETNCDSLYPDAATKAKQAKDLGIAIIAESGNQGDAYGLSFPACLSDVLPVGFLDDELNPGEFSSIGPGMVLAQAAYNSLAPYRADNRDAFEDYPGQGKAVAVVAGIYAALRHFGNSAAASLAALQKSDQFIDDVVVKNIPIARYTTAKAWLEAQSDSMGLEVAEVTQVTATDLAVVLSSVPAKKTQTLVTGYEIYDFDSGSWQRTNFRNSKASAVVISADMASGWLRLVVSRAGKTGYSDPVAFSRAAKADPSLETPSGLDYLGQESSYLTPTEFESWPKSSVDWPTITDPALEKLELSYARDMQITGKGVTVAIIDDGFQSDHSYLSGGRVLDGLCLQSSDICYNGRDRQTGPAAALPNSNGDFDRDYHGTMVAGTIGGYPTAEATGGIAPEVTFIVARVDLNGSDEKGLFTDQALEWILGLTDKYNIAAINMSWGYSTLERPQVGSSDPCQIEPNFESLMSQLKDKGVASVIATGNEGLVHGIGGPACEESGISVGATDNDGSIIEYSNISSAVDIVAPARMHTSLSENTYGEGSGTSNSTPVVAGAFALAKQYRPDLSVDEVLLAMQKSADLVDDIFVKDIPRLNIRKFLDYITPGGPLDGQKPTISATAKGVTCEVKISANGGKSPVLRFRKAGDSTWRVIQNPESATSLSGLAARTSYEVEVGVSKNNLVMWSKRSICKTGSGGKPTRITGAQVEARGKDWAITYIPLASANGFAITKLNYRVGSKTYQAVNLGNDRYFLSKLTSAGTTKASIAFVNSKGSASWASLTIPRFVSRTYSSTAYVSSSSSSSLSSSQKNALVDEVGSLVGVQTIVCSALKSSKTKTTELKQIQSRARAACSHLKTVYKSARLSVKTKTVSESQLVGSVEVTITGKG